MHASVLSIDAAALVHNVKLLKSAAHGAEVLAMVKADAYGHSASLVCPVLAPHVARFGVATIDEALALPTTGRPVTVFRPVIGVDDAVREAVERGVTLTVLTTAAAEALDAIGKRASVQVMIDTGMTRCGCEPRHAAAVIDAVRRSRHLTLESVGTHLACADVPGDPSVAEQLRRFEASSSSAAASRHAANSGGLLLHGVTYDRVRPGISLYGVDPTGAPDSSRDLKLVATWTAPVVATHDVPAGTNVGYGSAYRTTKPTRIAALAVGYADGYRRDLGNRGQVRIHGRLFPVVGRVSMDLTTVECDRTVSVGDVATLLDTDPHSPLSVYAMAGQLETIGYEIFTRIGPRVRRVLGPPADAVGRPLLR